MFIIEMTQQLMKYIYGDNNTKCQKHQQEKYIGNFKMNEIIKDLKRWEKNKDRKFSKKISQI
jgi:hypothetical protein